MDETVNRNAYDAAAKEVLANRDLLALLLQAVVPGLDRLSPDEIKEKCFIYPSEANGISQRGLNVEDNEKAMGNIRYDLLYEFQYPNSNKTFLVNIEMQKNRVGYAKLVNRAFYYLSRLVSRKRNVDFESDDYKNMKPVYGIWLMTYFTKSFAVKYSLLPEVTYGVLPTRKKQRHMKVVLIGIGDEDTCANKLARALYLLFKSKLSDTMIEKELANLGIHFTVKEWEGVVKMHWAEEYWKNVGHEDVALEMLKAKEPIEKIQKFTKISIQTLKELAKRNNIVI